MKQLTINHNGLDVRVLLDNISARINISSREKIDPYAIAEAVAEQESLDIGKYGIFLNNKPVL